MKRKVARIYIEIMWSRWADRTRTDKINDETIRQFWEQEVMRNASLLVFRRSRPAWEDVSDWIRHYESQRTSAENAPVFYPKHGLIWGISVGIGTACAMFGLFLFYDAMESHSDPASWRDLLVRLAPILLRMALITGGLSFLIASLRPGFLKITERMTRKNRRI